MEDKKEYERIRWACRRGMLELDKILLQFFENEYLQMSKMMQEKFVELLKENDQDLHLWLLGSDLPRDGKYQDLIMMIRFIINRRKTTTFMSEM